MEHPNVTLGHFTPRDPAFRSVFYTRHKTETGLVQAALVPRPDVQEREGVLNTSIALERPAFTFRDVFDTLPRRAAGRLDLVRLWAKKRRGLNAATRHAERTLLALSLWRGSSDLRRFLPGLRRGRGARSAWTYRVYCRSEQHPDPQSRVGLGRSRDALGLPQLVLNWHLSPLDLKTLSWARGSLGDALESHGAFYPATDREVGDEVKGGWHHMGTTRMSTDPRKGVVDPDGRVHTLENLYVAGSSVFPTAGYANPTLTIVALALRLADHLRDRLLPGTPPPAPEKG
jgi:choline dehydrogenase-like flavoprotein